MSKDCTIAVVQARADQDTDRNLVRAAEQVRRAAGRGAQIVLLPELFAHRYFPRAAGAEVGTLARPVDDSAEVTAMAELCRELQVVMAVSFFELDGARRFNSVAVLDADGERLGVYRKSHIPDGPGYYEKQYFSPGDTGFRVWPTRHGKLGVGICWDQWFPECARAMCLQGAEVLLYPSTIGSEPEDPGLDTSQAWRAAMLGHAVCNSAVVAAANRVGDENGQVYYGSSFICDAWGRIVAELDREQEGIAIAELDLDSVLRQREWMGLMRDRRPDLYRALTDSRKE